MKSMHLRTVSRGFTVIEIMIALVLGLILSAGVTNVYLTTKQNYNVSENLGRMQESARFAMAELQRNVRMAGYIPCRITGNTVNTLDTTSSLFDFFNGSMVGFEGGVSTFPAEFPNVGTGKGDRVAGTDGILILRGSDETYSVVQHNPKSADFKVNDLHDLKIGEVLLVCDGFNSAIFQVSNVNASNVNVVHNTGDSVEPGNCKVFLGGKGECGDESGMVAYTYGPESQLVKFVSMGYYIGVSSSGDSRSLYRLSLDVSGAGVLSHVPQELVRNIENMQILYGEDTDNDKQIEQYLTAENVTNWNNVLNVRIGILAQTPDGVNSDIDNKVYNLAGTQVGTSTTVTHEADKRIRYAFGSTVNVRNRGLY